MDDYLAWRGKSQPWLHSAVTDAKNGQKLDNSVALKELSTAHIDLIPELREIQNLAPMLQGPRDVWIREKLYHVRFASAGGIPRYLPFRWIGSSWSRDTEFVEVRNRFMVAIVGGLSLIVPMLIMILHKSIATSLVTISVAVVLFASTLAAWPVIHNHLPWVKRWKKMGGQDIPSFLGAREVLLVTAAYAAVLVVFVGSNGP
jgi:hypothetical protein